LIPFARWRFVGGGAEEEEGNERDTKCVSIRCQKRFAIASFDDGQRERERESSDRHAHKRRCARQVSAGVNGKQLFGVLLSKKKLSGSGRELNSGPLAP
jgi:hypothetical protein